jgi:hypothetical protein
MSSASSSLSASQSFVQQQNFSSSSSSSSGRKIARRHRIRSNKIQHVRAAKVSSTEQDVIANNAVQILKPNGEPKVVYIFNSKTCDGGAELKDILGNKCVSFFHILLQPQKWPRGCLLELTNELWFVHVFLRHHSQKKRKKKNLTTRLEFFLFLKFECEPIKITHTHTHTYHPLFFFFFFSTAMITTTITTHTNT